MEWPKVKFVPYHYLRCQAHFGHEPGRREEEESGLELFYCKYKQQVSRKCLQEVLHVHHSFIFRRFNSFRLGNRNAYRKSIFVVFLSKYNFQ